MAMSKLVCVLAVFLAVFLTAPRLLDVADEHVTVLTASNFEDYVGKDKGARRARRVLRAVGRGFEMFGPNAIPCRAATRVLSHVRAAAEVTQHDRIWEIYLKVVSQEGVPIETSLRVYRRFLKYDPTHVEDFIEFLQSSELWQEAAERLAQVLHDENFFSRKGKTLV